MRLVLCRLLLHFARGVCVWSDSLHASWHPLAAKRFVTVALRRDGSVSQNAALCVFVLYKLPSFGSPSAYASNQMPAVSAMQLVSAIYAELLGNSVRIQP